MTTDDLTEQFATLRPKLHRYCARMVGSAFEGEDIVQETFARAVAALADGQHVDRPEAWLFRIAHNLAIDALRRPGRATLALPDDGLVDDYSDTETRASARMALSSFLTLPPMPREVVVLIDVLGHSGAEAAAILDISLASVKAALHRGRARLRNRNPMPTPIDPDERERLGRYADLFNAHDWDALRLLLADDVRLDLVNRTRLSGAREVGVYFTRYAEASGWNFRPAIADGRLVLLSESLQTGALDFVVTIDWRDDRVAAIRDFHFARYICDSLDITA